MSTVSHNDVPDTGDPLEDLITFLSLFELHNFNYMEFAMNLNSYYNEIITVIEKNKVSLSNPQYNKYIQLCTNKINRLNVPEFPNTNKLISAVGSYDDWSKIKKYKLILFVTFDSNTELYKDLSLNFLIAGEMKNEEGDKIMTLQELFYQAAYNLSIYEIKSCLQDEIVLYTEDDYFPDIFKKRAYFQIFKDYIDNHLIDPYNDISYIYQKLLALAYIHPIKHISFVEWLGNNEFIDSDIKDDIIEKGGLISFRKSASKTREKIFKNLSEKHLP